MHNKLKKFLIVALAASMILPYGSVVASSDTEETTATATEEAADETSEKKDEEVVRRTEAEALAACRLVAENDNFEFYLNEDEVLIGLRNKATQYTWWSSPINADADPYAKKAQIKEEKSLLGLTFAEPSKRRTTTVHSGAGGKAKFKDIKNGVQITIDFTKADIKIPVQYTLYNDYLEAKIVTSEIVEDNKENDKLTANIRMSATFGAAGEDETGYFVIPDGSGALIYFNNGKTGFRTYSQKVYGEDITAVSNLRGPKTEQIYLPVYGIVKDDNALMVIADKGDTNVTINSFVARQNNTAYNGCYFEFELRGDDEYLMGGETNPLTVFEQGDIKTPEIAVRYYPLAQEEISYIQVADAYRDYLVAEKGVAKRDTVATASFYLDVYGGAMKTKSVLGIPVKLKTSMTSYSEAQEIVEKLVAQGVDDIVLAYNNWTNEGITQKIDNKAKPSSVLGGSGDWKKLLKYCEEQGIAVYPAVENKVFKSGNGFNTFTDTAIRVSGSYSRQYTYDLAHGIPSGFFKPMSLFSPGSYAEAYEKLAKNYSKAGLKGVSLGSATTALYGDYTKKKPFSRDAAAEILEEQFANLDNTVGSILADSANAYALPYVDHITNVPLTSSGFDLFDLDIPFYQLVVHGLIPYSTTAINGNADSNELFLRALAAGSSLHYDMIYEEATELKDTTLDEYFYANYENWISTCAAQYKMSKDIIEEVSDQQIVNYVVDGDEITTTYANGDVTVIDLGSGSISLNGKELFLKDYLQEGDLID